MIKIIKKVLCFILDIPITIFFNFYYLPIKQAIKLPLRVSHKIRINNMGRRNSVSIEDANERITIGKNGSFALGYNEKLFWNISKDAKVIFKGKATLCRGTQIICGNNSCIIFGQNFYCNANCILNSDGNLEFGEDVLIGWNTQILTGDGHNIFEVGKIIKDSHKGNIKIGKHVWIASNSVILDNAQVNDNSVIATRALVSKPFIENNLLIGKYNEILKTNINWEK